FNNNAYHTYIQQMTEFARNVENAQAHNRIVNNLEAFRYGGQFGLSRDEYRSVRLANCVSLATSGDEATKSRAAKARLNAVKNSGDNAANRVRNSVNKLRQTSDKAHHDAAEQESKKQTALSGIRKDIQPYLQEATKVTEEKPEAYQKMLEGDW